MTEQEVEQVERISSKVRATETENSIILDICFLLGLVNRLSAEVDILRKEVHSALGERQ